MVMSTPSIKFYEDPNHRLNPIIYQTYLLLAASITVYLLGAHFPLIKIDIDNGLSGLFTCLAIVFGSLIMIFIKKHYIFLMTMSLGMGFIHNCAFEKIYQTDASIIYLSLGSTMCMFYGLSVIGFMIRTTNRMIFVISGLIFISFTLIVVLGFLNVFFRSGLLELFLIWIGVFILSVSTIIDTYQLANSANSTNSRENNPVIHATKLFLNFLNLFINVLKICVRLRDRNNKNKTN